MATLRLIYSSILAASPVLIISSNITGLAAQPIFDSTMLQETSQEKEGQGNRGIHAQEQNKANPLDGKQLGGEALKDSKPVGLSADVPIPEPISQEATIVVTGTHIRGAVAAGANIDIYDFTDIERSGYATVHDFINTLPQNFAGGGGSEAFSPGSLVPSNLFGGSSVSLRGLGADSTLVLINGRRPPASEPRRVCRRLQLLSRMEHHEQDDEQVFP